MSCFHHDDRPRFVIVLEVDNVRAARAYSGALAAFDAKMPDMRASAEQRDRNCRAVKEAQRALHDSVAPKPVRNWRGRVTNHTEIMLHESRAPMVYPSSPHTESLLSIRHDLAYMSKLASAAVGPFRMTERQVADMIAWEDGSQLEHLERTYLQEPTP